MAKFPRHLVIVVEEEDEMSYIVNKVLFFVEVLQYLGETCNGSVKICW